MKLTKDHPKYSRGFLEFYNKLFEYIEPKTIVEVGIGIGICPVGWAKAFPEAEVVGIEISSPVLQHCIDNELHTRQYKYIQECFHNLLRQHMSVQKRIHLHHNRDGYSKDTAQEVLETYGQLDFVIDDGKQDGKCHKEFLKNWKHVIKDDGLIIRERAFRYPDRKGIRMGEARKALTNGWIIIDCREFNPDVHLGEPLCKEGFLALWSNNQDLWVERLQDQFNLYIDGDYSRLLETGCLIEEDPCH